MPCSGRCTKPAIAEMLISLEAVPDYGNNSMNSNTRQLTIGALAKETGVGVETIRYYQRRGLVAEPERPYGRIRRYGTTDVQRLRFIRTAQDLGFSLDEVGELLKLADGMACADAQRIASGKLDKIRERKTNLERIETVLLELLARCRLEHGTATCPLIEALAEGGPSQRRRAGSS